MLDDIIRIKEIKRKVRKLKQFELMIRFNNIQPLKPLVWDQFFDLHGKSNKNAKYSLEDLILLNQEEYKNIINEFFSYVYFELYHEQGLTHFQGIYDPALLEKLDLPFDANENDIKKRFRELANKYHPDKGGDAKKFIELMDYYKKLLQK